MTTRRIAIVLACILAASALPYIVFGVWVSAGISHNIDTGEPAEAHGMGSGLAGGELLLVAAVIVGGSFVSLLLSTAVRRR